jgi:two-component system chemotaxis response regulator CheB
MSSAEGPIRVLVADDSAFSRVTLSKMIEKDPGISVVATAVNGEEAIRLAMEQRPDLLTLDLEMPGMDGFAVLRWLSANRPIPTIVVSSRNGREDVFKALDLGAVDFIVKPQARASAEYERLESVLVAKIHAVAGARPARAAPAVRSAPPPLVGTPPPALVVIGASTGGPAAVALVLAALPPMPGPVVIAQHMPSGFTGLFAERLARICSFPVVEARDGESLRPGSAYVAPGGAHAEIQGRWPALSLRVVSRSPEDFYAPAVDRLFTSAARVAGPKAVAVLLTGMGSDGKEGMLAVQRAGGRTLVESEETAVVYGMPGEAVRSGAADEILALPDIAPAIVRLVGGGNPPA